MENPNQAMHQAARKGDREALDEALNHNAEIDAVDRHGRPVLHGAAAAAVQPLVAAGADPNATDNRGSTALHKTVSPEKTRALVDAGADPTIRNERGNTPYQNLQHLQSQEGQRVLRMLDRAEVKRDLAPEQPQKTERRRSGRCREQGAEQRR